MPVPWMAWQVAGEGHSPVFLGWQISAQYVAVVLPGSSSTHSALAVVPGGRFAGQPPDEVHGGEQKSPGTPVTVTFISVAWHGGSAEVECGVVT
jgi:hypothetical protein